MNRGVRDAAEALVQRIGGIAGAETSVAFQHFLVRRQTLEQHAIAE